MRGSIQDRCDTHMYISLVHESGTIYTNTRRITVRPDTDAIADSDVKKYLPPRYKVIIPDKYYNVRNPLSLSNSN